MSKVTIFQRHKLHVWDDLDIQVRLMPLPLASGGPNRSTVLYSAHGPAREVDCEANSRVSDYGYGGKVLSRIVNQNSLEYPLTDRSRSIVAGQGSVRKCR